MWLLRLEKPKKMTKFQKTKKIASCIKIVLKFVIKVGNLSMAKKTFSSKLLLNPNEDFLLG